MLTALFTSSDRQLDTKERRRYELKLSKAPNMRTVIIAVLAFILIGTAVDAFARELRVTTYADLARCAGTVVAGTRVIAAGPDAGQTSAAGDTCVVFPGIYAAADADVDGDLDPIYVTLENITIRSSNGALATTIVGAGLAIVDTTDPDGLGGPLPAIAEVGVIVVMADGVTIGGPKTDQGLTIQGAAIGVPALVSGIAIGPVGTPAGQADENITVQNNVLRANGGAGIIVLTAGSLELFKFQDNIIRENPFFGIFYTPLVASIGRRGADRNIVISRNYLANNFPFQVAFGNTGTAEQVAVVENKILNEGLPFPVGFVGTIFFNVGEVRNSLIASNMMQNHLLAGLVFLNTGRVDTVDIIGNKGTTPQQGITFNGLVGVAFLRFPGIGVTEIRDVNITDNAINSNGLFGGVFTFFFPGFAGGDTESFNLVNNNIRQNLGPGFTKLFGGDFTRSNFEGNTFRNNAVAGFLTLHGISRFSENSFTRNDFRENGGLGMAVAAIVPPATGDIERLTLTSNTYVKNTLFGYIFATDAGDIAQIKTDGDEVLENGPGVLAPPFGGSGAVYVTNAIPLGGVFAGAGDIEDIEVTNAKYNNNAGFGMTITSLTTAVAPAARGDVAVVKVSNTQFNNNGTRAPVGLGSGFQVAAESVREVSFDTSTANNNNDHGMQLTASRDLSLISISNSEFNNNDRNVDTVGNGIDISVNESGNDVTISNVKANSNNSGIRLSSQDRIGRNYTIEKSEINDNRDSGVDLFSGEDLDTVAVKQNKLMRNAIGIRVDVEDRGSRIEFTENKITGDNGTGVGVLINSVGVKVEKNSIRRNATGIEVRKQRDNQIVNNNIARNENFGVDATALSPGVTIDAKNNWWGEPSGPKHATNPNGIGDRVTDRVDFMPFLGEPAVPTEDLFQVLSLTASDNDVAVGDSVTFKYTIKNNGTEEGTQEVTVVIKDGLGNVVNQFSRQITVNQGASRDDTFSFIFTVSGEYTVTVSTPDDSKSVKVTVAGEAACLPFALDTNKNKVLDDGEIITAIDLWVKNGDVPGCSPPKKISDTQIIQLIDLWVKGSQLTVPLGSKMVSQSATLSVASTFATLGASVRAVRPGESFVVTVNVDAKDGISGLLLSQALPAGWSAKPIQMSGAYFKASENKWLWLNAKGTVSVSYEVTVPATAQPGLYTIAGRVKAAVPGIESELQPLTVEVLGAPVALAVKAITLSQQPVRTGGAYFAVEGVGIAQTTVRVFSLTGKLVFSQTAQGNVVPFSAAAELANGVYLYVVTVQGADGQTVTSSIAKLVVLR
jgi:hypothetical protein